MPKVTIHKLPRFAVIIHDVRSILNVGSIFRTADGVGADMVYLTGYTPGPDTHPDKMSKTALGAENIIPWQRVRRVGDLARYLKSQRVRVVALEQTSKSVDYRKYKPKFPLALIVGNEVNGIGDTSHNVADAIIEIPMRGRKESLNVAVAFGIAAYEMTRKIHD